MQRRKLYFHIPSQANATWEQGSTEFQPGKPQPYDPLPASKSKRPMSPQPNTSNTSPPQQGSDLLLIERPIRYRPDDSDADKLDQVLSQDIKRGLLGDDQLSLLLSSLKTDDFVGEIDPEYHSPYLSAPADADLLAKLVRLGSDCSLQETSRESLNEWMGMDKEVNPMASMQSGSTTAK